MENERYAECGPDLNRLDRLGVAGWAVAQQKVSKGYDGQISPTSSPQHRGIPEELARMQDAINQIGEGMNILASRLGPMLLDTSDTSSGNSGARTPDSHVCQIAEMMRQQRREVENFAAALRDLSRRIDL